MTDTSAEKSKRPEPTLELLATLYTLEQLEDASHDMPQLALAGRSNVGKSSLINALARRKKLAKVSSEPGKTRSVNLFRVNPDGFCLTDLPGYGYARRGHEERRNWAALIQKYLEQTPTLRALVLLIDCRIPTQESDRVMADFARAKNLPVIAVLTKADKCTLKERSAQQKTWEKILGGERPVVVSSVTRLGLDELWARLREAGAPAETTCEPENDAPSRD
ncbi:ribosome biogenesis GTP-binding protein YihA/YsxC [Mailhella massiliensis]|uniref:ribosome biogenesis GTP-binding protein YihA/YsxC n=1 Tax=Mailhella massiliensis TaxID=1903261 RepID=UPI002352C0CD|nr:ribosome biogenesis GTP-binding protein YihA/YsxC [Mailhella massiliensis]